MAKIRGLILHSRINYLEKHLDAAQRKAFFEGVDEKTRVLLSDLVFPVNLYRFDYVSEIDRVLSEQAGLTPSALGEKMGGDFAVLMLDRYFFNYINDQNPGGFLEQSQRLYPDLWHFGSLSISALEKSGCILSISHPQEVHELYLRFLQHYFSKGIEICGTKNVSLNSLDSDKATEISWKFNWD